VDPSGTFFRGSGFAIGQSSDIALDIIQRQYNADMDIDQAIELSTKAIERALGEKPLVETGVIIKNKNGEVAREEEGSKFKKLL
jgi:proteasome alpha subunit